MYTSRFFSFLGLGERERGGGGVVITFSIILEVTVPCSLLSSIYIGVESFRVFSFVLLTPKKYCDMKLWTLGILIKLSIICDLFWFWVVFRLKAKKRKRYFSHKLIYSYFCRWWTLPLAWSPCRAWSSRSFWTWAVTFAFIERPFCRNFHSGLVVTYLMLVY